MCITGPLTELEESIKAFEQKADQRECDELINARKEFGKLLCTAQKLHRNQQGQGSEGAHFPRIAWHGLKSSYKQFSETAFRFSKQLDSLVLAAPSYVQAVWGAIHLLLMAQINDQRLKQSIPEYLASITRKFELLESLTSYVPTKLMVEGLAQVYAAYLIFLRDAVKFYSESRARRLGNAFVKPWDVRFQPNIDRIAQAIEHVDQIGRVIAVGTLQSLSSAVQSLQDNLLRMRTVVLDEVKDNRDLLLRVEQRLSERSRIFSTEALGPREPMPETSRRASASSQPPAASPHETVSDAGLVLRNGVDLDDLRDSIFPALKEVEDLLRERRSNREHGSPSSKTRHERAKEANVETIIEWVESKESDLLWLDGHGVLDERLWDLGFVQPVIADLLSSVDNSIVLNYFCKGLGIPTRLNTARTVIQTLIFQLLRQHKQTLQKHTNLVSKSRLREIAGDFDKSWQLFEDYLQVCSPARVLIILGAVDLLSDQAADGTEGSSETPLLIERLGALARSPGMVVKILVTADTDSKLRHKSPNGKSANDDLVPRDSDLEISYHIPRNKLPTNTEKNLEILTGKCRQIKFEDIWLLYSPRSVIYTMHNGNWNATIVSELAGMETYEEGLAQRLRPLTVRCWEIRQESGNLVRCRRTFTIHQFSNSRPISSLKHIPANYLESEADVRRNLIERGKQYCAFSQGHHYRELLSSSTTTERNGPRRVVVDFKNAPVTFSTSPEVEGEPDEEGLSHIATNNFKPFVYLTCPASVPAYDLKQNVWSEVAINSLRTVPRCGKGILNTLNLSYGDTEMLFDGAETYLQRHDLFRNQNEYTESDYMNRRSGLLTLLHGPPASGMTFTVDAIAEILHRPVLKIMGSLITDDTNAQSRLCRLLDLATAWDAVVLMKDVDIVFQAYSESTSSVSLAATASLVREEIQRFSGLLYVITHRVANFDVSYHSLFTVVIRFSGWTPDARTGAMKKLLEEVGYNEGAADWDEVHDWLREELCRGEHLDGRRMRSLVHVAAMQARANDGPIRRFELKGAARMAMNFTQQMIEQSLRQTQRRFDL